MAEPDFIASSGNKCVYSIVEKNGKTGVAIGWDRPSTPEDQQEFEEYLTPIVAAIVPPGTPRFSTSVETPGAKAVAEAFLKVADTGDFSGLRKVKIDPTKR